MPINATDGLIVSIINIFKGVFNLRSAFTAFSICSCENESGLYTYLSALSLPLPCFIGKLFKDNKTTKTEKIVLYFCPQKN